MHVGRAVAIPVIVYGNRAYDDTMLELKNELVSCGFKVPAAVAAVAEHSKSHPESVDEKVCISCMRCIAVCPVRARTLNKLVLAAASAKMKKACSTRKENELFTGEKFLDD